jgi:FkbM family methyltransferase
MRDYIARLMLLFKTCDKQYRLAALRILAYYGFFHLSRNKRAFRERWNSKEVVLSLNGVKFSVSAIPGDLGFIFEVFLGGVYESVPSFIPKPGDVCLDIGANIGSTALRWNLKNPGGRIICVEPHPVTFKRLQKNIEINKYANIEAYPYAVSNSGGSIEMYSDEGSSMMTANVKLTRPKQFVEAVTIDMLVKKLKINNIDLCKIDVEGHEINVLKGATNSLPLIRRLVIEYHSDSLNKDIHAMLKKDFSIIREEGARHMGLIFAENNSNKI